MRINPVNRIIHVSILSVKYERKESVENVVFCQIIYSLDTYYFFYNTGEKEHATLFKEQNN